MLASTETWVRRLGMLGGLVAILIPLLGFSRADRQRKGARQGRGIRLLNWPTTFGAFILYLVGGFLLWRPLPIRLSPTRRWGLLLLGMLLYFPGIGLYLWGYKTLGRLFSPSSSFGVRLYRDHTLITAGPYRFVRHPMYLGVILAAAGALILYRTWTAVFYALSALAVIARARKEEEILAQTFGQEWENYQTQVPGWLPRFW